VILDTSATPILERWKTAREAENAAIDRLHSALTSGEKNQKVLLKLTEEMEAAHNASMLVYRELEAVRLDKH